MSDTPKINIDFIGNLFGPRPQGLGSFPIVARRMIEGMYHNSELRAYNTQGTIWLHLPKEEADKVPKEVLAALSRGRKPKDGISYDHVGLCHGHPDHYNPRTQKHQVGYSQIINRYKTKILMTVCESDPIPDIWVDKSQIFDMIFVPSEYCKVVWDKAFKKHRVKMDVKVVPHGVESWMKPLENRGSDAISPTLRALNQNEKFKFLTIFTALSYPHRKGIDKAIKAFFKEFKPDEKVMYIIKTEDEDYLRKLVDKYSNGCEVLILDEKLEPTDLVKLYNIADGYVMPSRGEGWGLDLSNAIGCGLPSVSTKYSGMLDFGEGYTNWVNIEKELVQGDCYSNVEGFYAEPDLKSLRSAMRGLTKNIAKSRISAIKRASTFHNKWSWGHAGDVAIGYIDEFLFKKYGERRSP